MDWADLLLRWTWKWIKLKRIRTPLSSQLRRKITPKPKRCSSPILQRFRKKEKRAKMVDKFSNIPEPLRNRILSLLPLQDVIRTSALSRKWRNVCSSLTHLEFNQPTFQRLARRSKRQFPDFVNQLLLFHDELDLQKFTLFVDMDDGVSVSHVTSWVSFAVRRNVKEFSLGVLDGDLERFPSCLFTCSELRVLSLDNVKLRLPYNIELPKLKTMKLMSVQCFDEELTNKLFSKCCPVLEELFMCNCSFEFFRVLKITCPKLKLLSVFDLEPMNLDVEISGCNLDKMQYNGDLPSITPEVLLSLVAADFQIMPPRFVVARRQDVYSRASLTLIGMQSVTRMALRDFYIECLARDQSLLTCLPVTCSSLEELHLEMYPTETQVQVAMLLLRSYPNLKHLRLCIKAQETSVILLHSGVDWQSRGMFMEEPLKKLQTMSIEGFKGSESELDILHFLLENADTLERMNLMCQFQELDAVSLVSINEKIAAWTKASTAVIAVSY